MVAVRREPTLKRRLAMVSSVQRKVSNGIAGSIPAEILAYARAAYPQRRSLSWYRKEKATPSALQ